jgi:hypothetical protein
MTSELARISGETLKAAGADLEVLQSLCCVCACKSDILSIQIRPGTSSTETVSSLPAANGAVIAAINNLNADECAVL